MENKLKVLNAELELIKEANNIKYDQLMQKTNTLISKLIMRNNAMLTRSWVTTSFNEILFLFDIGFYNTVQQKLDWGSEISFAFSSETGQLSINHGCIGSFDKTNVCQFQRAALISYIFDNIDEIESEFKKLVNFAKDFIYRKDETAIEIELRNIHQELKTKELKNIESSIKEGLSLAYEGECDIPNRHKLFAEVATVVRCTPKYVFLREESEMLLKLKKEDIVDHIYKGYIVYV